MSILRYVRQPSRLLRKASWWLLHRGPRRDVSIDTFNGRITFDSHDRLIGKQLWLERGYERDYIERTLRLLREQRLLREDGVLVDVGANIGMICIALMRQALFARALAFEPAPGNVRLLERNIADNGLSDRIAVVAAALTSTSGVLELELAAGNSGDNRVRRTTEPGAYGENRRATVQVPALTLTQALGDAHIDASKLALIWVDIQGHEADFLLGARDVIRPGLPVVCEFWPYGILRSGTSRQRCMQIVTELFTTAWLLDADPIRAVPAAELDTVFDTHAGSRQYREVLLIRDSPMVA